MNPSGFPNFSALATTFEEIRQFVAIKFPSIEQVMLAANTEVHSSPRSYGRALLLTAGPLIEVAPELAYCPCSRIRGVLAHEFGHCLVLLGHFEEMQHLHMAELQADAIAESIFGEPIVYTLPDMVQAMGAEAVGVRPRPFDLDAGGMLKVTRGETREIIKK